MLQLITTALAALLSSQVLGDVSVSGSLKKWHPIIVDNSGATATLSEAQLSPNPFLDFRYNVIFTSPSGNEYTVPGYFAGNGTGGGIGSVWRAKFSADETGEWQYRISFRRGENISVSDSEGTAMPSDGETGSFTVTENSPDDPGFLAVGRLQYTGEHYLKFADGPYWLKGGVDSPENFFGYAGFDNTVDQPDGIDTAGLSQGLHLYEPHISDWQESDPLFTNSAAPEAAKGIIGAINYLASEEVNSLYFLPMNLGGDGRDTYPFIKPSGDFFNNTHYDISKLYQWGIVLEHMQNKGIATHFVLAERERGNTNWFDDGQLGIERKLFYRELVARYSYLLAIKWNISEESRFGAERHKSFAGYLDDVDWAGFPIAVHGTKDRPYEQYDDIIGDPLFTASSIQFSPHNSGAFVEEWRRKSADSGWPWVIDMDEIGPARIGVTDENAASLRKSVLYPVYFSGGNIEWYFGYHALPLGGDLRTEDFRTREEIYRYTRIARNMMQQHLPFWRMQPADHLYNGITSAEVFSDTGRVYAIYLSDASSPGTLTVEPGEYAMQWFNPRTGEYADGVKSINAESTIELDGAPTESAEDWVVLLKLSDDIDAEQPTDAAEGNGDSNETAGDNPPVDESPDEAPAAATPPTAQQDSAGSMTTSMTLLLLLLVYCRQFTRRQQA